MIKHTTSPHGAGLLLEDAQNNAKSIRYAQEDKMRKGIRCSSR